MPANVHRQTITRSEPRRAWWAKFLKDTGAGFWRETDCMRGGREAIYDNLPHPIGFAPNVDARGARDSALQRGAGSPSAEHPTMVPESDIYHV